ncbi:MAG: GNAT family N-acetyltransferase [Spirochaetaceae bacterium]|nr:GNAT family N-acetyltransferase [Spirochaetaceae bacterium]
MSSAETMKQLIMADRLPITTAGSQIRPVSGFVRVAVTDDIGQIASMRVAFIRQIKNLTEAEQDELLDAQAAMFRSGMDNGSILMWVYQVGGEIVGSAALLFRQARGRPVQAELMAVYTVVAYRRQGVATALVCAALSHARQIGLGSVSLQPTGDSFELYRSLGFFGDHESMVIQFST